MVTKGLEHTHLIDIRLSKQKQKILDWPWSVKNLIIIVNKIQFIIMIVVLYISKKYFHSNNRDSLRDINYVPFIITTFYDKNYFMKYEILYKWKYK